MSRVQDAHVAVEDLDTAQRYFQDADMAHDAVRADAGALLLHVLRAVPAPPEAAAELRRRRSPTSATISTRSTASTLPADLDRQVRAVRP